MNIIYFLIGCSIIMALLFLAAFFWALKDGQHDDMHTPAIRILFEDDKPEKADNLALITGNDEGHISAKQISPGT